MRRLVLIAAPLACLWAAPLSTASALTPAQQAVLFSGSNYTGPGDVAPGAAAFWGLRAYSKAQAFSRSLAVNIRRASDNATMPVSVLQNGSLDSSSAAGFCSATSCSIATWYDQTVNSNNCVQATAANQPALSLTGGNGSTPTVIVGVGQFFTCGTSATLDVAGAGYSLSLWTNITALPGSGKQFDLFLKAAQNLAGSGYGLAYVNTGPALNLYKAGVANQSLTQSLGTATWHHVLAAQAFSAAPTSVTYYLDGASAGSASNASAYQSSAGQTVYLGGGATNAASLSLNGSMSNVLVYPSTLSAAQVTALFANGY